MLSRFKNRNLSRLPNRRQTGIYQTVQKWMAILEAQGRGAERNLRMVEDYQITNVSEKVARIIVSYTDYVNRVVWHKNL